TDALDEKKWLNMLGTFVKDWSRYESHFVYVRDSLVDILKDRGLLSESDAVQPLIGKKSDRKSGSAGMPRPSSYAVFCLKKKKSRRRRGSLPPPSRSETDPHHGPYVRF